MKKSQGCFDFKLNNLIRFNISKYSLDTFVIFPQFAFQNIVSLGSQSDNVSSNLKFFVKKCRL